MYRILSKIILFVLVLRPLTVHCETLCLEHVLSSVDQNFPLILGAQQDVENSYASYFGSKGAFDPSLKASLSNTSSGYYNHHFYDISLEQPTALWGTKVITGYRKGQGNFPVYDARYLTFSQGEFRAGLEIPILQGGGTDVQRTKIASHEIGIQVARQNFESKRLEIKREAAKKYWDWIATGRKLLVAQQLLDIALLRDRALLTRVTQGDAAKIDHTDNQRAVVQRQESVLSARRNLQKSSIELSIYYRDLQGRPIIPSPQSLPKNFPKVGNEKKEQDFSDRLDEVTLNHPDTQTLNFQLEQINFERNLAQNQLLPKLNFGIFFVRDLGVNPGTSYIPPTNYPFELKTAISFEMPLFLRTARGNLTSVSTNRQKMQYIQELTRDRLKSNILNASQSLATAKVRIEFAKKEVVLSKKLEEAETIRFQHGDSSLMMVNLREQTTQDAMNKEIEALSDYFKSKIDFETFTANSGKI